MRRDRSAKSRSNTASPRPNPPTSLLTPASPGRRHLVLSCLLVLPGCAATPSSLAPGTPLQRTGDEIVVAGQFFHTGAPVVLWMDPGGYDAYRTEPKFAAGSGQPGDDRPARTNRYGSFRRHLPDEVAEEVRTTGWSLPLLQEWVDQFVIHYDVAGTSRRCFQVLQDLRGLSVHFLLDLDGTIYQTLDAKERAWHATTANDRSVGIEIANIGAYPDMETLSQWYGDDEGDDIRVTLPEWIGPSGLRTAGFVARPARREPVRGQVQGRDLIQYDLTDQQYESLIKLTATLVAALPLIEPDYPRDEEGNLRTTKLTAEEMADHRGLLGHFHVDDRKIDPGPAFDWDRLVEGVRRALKR